MPIAATAVWEVRTTGDDLNGGAFNPARTPAGTDYSQQDAAQVTIDGATISATVHSTTTQITLVGYTVLAADNGNHLRISGGTATAGVYEITAVDTVNNRYTLDRSAGTSTQTVQGRIGGANASIGTVGGLAISGNAIHIKSGTYAIGTGTTNTSGNRALFTSTQRISGYQTTRNDGGTKPILQASGGTMTVLAINASDSLLTNVEIDGNSQTALRGVSSSNTLFIYKCTIRNCTNTGVILTGASAKLVESYLPNCGGSFGAVSLQAGGQSILDCTIDGGNSFGIYVTGGDGFVLDRNTVANTGSTGISLTSTANLSLISNCITRNCGSGGVSIAGGATVIRNCISYGNTTYNFSYNPTAGSSVYLINCTGPTKDTFPIEVGFITLSADPFTNAAGGDFTLNNTAGGGALLRGTGYPATFPGLSPTNYLDVGAYQRQVTAASSAQSASGFIV